MTNSTDAQREAVQSGRLTLACVWYVRVCVLRTADGSPLCSLRLRLVL